MISAATVRNQDVHFIDQAKRTYLKRPIILFCGQPGDAVRAMIADNCDLLKLKRVTDDHLLLRDPAGSDLRISEAPAFVMAVMAFAPSDIEMASRAVEWLRKRTHSSLPDVFQAGPEDVAAVASHLLANAEQIASRHAAMATSLFRQLADARQANEDLQNRFAALEAFIDRAGLQPFDLAFINPPLDDEAEPNVLGTAGAGGISQILPVASAGVSAIGIHIARAAPRSTGMLNAALQTVEDGRLVETWSLPIAEIGAGWLTLGLQKSLAGLRRTLRLIVSVDDARADLPSLSLGNAQPLPLFRVQDADLRQSISSASLALQVYVGLPGVVPPGRGAFAGGRRQEKGEPGLREFALPASLLGATHQVNLDSDSSGFEGVSYLDGERIVSCHPPAFGSTIAKVAGGCPEGAVRVSANLLVAHEKARDVEFALVVSRDENRVVNLLAGAVDPQPGEGFSGWVRVPAQQPRFASLFLDAPARECSDLYLVTRMVNPGNHDFAWARFLNLHALVQG